MAECGPAIQLCKAGEDVFQKLFLIFQISEQLQPAVNELKKSFFVRF